MKILVKGLKAIKAYGQEAEVREVEFISKHDGYDIRFNLTTPIVVPTTIYTRDYVLLDEIEDFIIN